MTDMNNMASDMARIIGRYKGATTVYAQELAKIAQDQTLNKHAKARIEVVVDRLFNMIAENEELWANRLKRELEEVA
jgi:hypothetical protein